MIKKITSTLILFTTFLNSSFAVLNTPLITSPADASTANPANTIINWYNVSGANSYEFKIDTNAALTVALVQTSTSSQFTNSQLLFGTTYYWQVRALKTTGTHDSSAWTQIFSFETLDSLHISAPANGAVNQFPKVYLNWSNAAGITNYEVQLDVVNTFNSAALYDTLFPDSTSNLYVYKLRFGTVYYWRVRAMHALDTTHWSNSSFSTLDSVVLSAPANGASFLAPSNLLLNWDYISGITNYQVELDKDPAFNSSALQSIILPDTLSQWIAGDLDFGTNYYWRVRVWHALDTSQWSQIWNFTTVSALTLNSPADNSINQFPNVILNWNYITTPIFYDVEFDTSASFSSPLYTYASNDTVSEHQTSELLFGTKYYWRARAHNTVDTSQWSSIWSFTTIDYLNLVSPTNGAVNIPTRVTLNWTYISGITGYDIRIDTSANYSSALSAYYSPTNSNQQVLNLYFGTKYYWSVRAHHAADTSSWTNNWAFTTADSVSLSAPANNSIDAAPRTTLNWINLSGSTAFIVEYDTSAAFSSPVLVSVTVLTSNALTSNLFFNQKYYWRVKAVNLVDTSSWSQVWNFTTLNQLVHISPLDGAVGQALLTQLNWSGVSGAVGYIYRFDTSPLFNINPQTGNSVGTTSNANITLPLYGQTYYWQVSVFDSVDTSAWSNPWSFTTVFQIASAPVLVSPANLSTGLPKVNITLTWNPVQGVFGYEYVYSTSTNFTNPVVANSLDTFGVITGLASYTTYYWRVRAYNASGYSPWSSVFSFTTLNPFTSAPILFTPEDLATDVPQPVTFTWYPLNFASSYECEYDVDSLFSSPISLASADTFVVSFVLDPLVTYYWRVKGIDGNANSFWSDVWSFTTENPLTTAPVLYAPADGSPAINAPANFTWYSLALASSYECEYDTDSLFSAPVTLLANDTNVISLPLAPLTKYFWRVRGILGNVSSPWSNVWSFSTENPLTTAPVLISPANSSTNISGPATFVWYSLFAAASYECEYGTDSLFTSATTLLANDTEIVSQLLTVSTKYFWRVRGALANIYSPWSSVWSFTSAGIFAPVQTSPADGDTVPYNLLQFYWDSVAFADGYECQYDTNSTFTTPVTLSTTATNSPNQIVLPLKTYFWRVRTTIGTQFSPWSSVWSVVTGFPVGITVVHSNPDVHLFPNPANDKVNLYFENKENKSTSVQLFSPNGSEAWNKNFNGVINETIDLSALAKGIYSIKMQTGAKVIVKKLIVK